MNSNHISGHTMVDWVKIPNWICYIADVRTLLGSCYKIYMRQSSSIFPSRFEESWFRGQMKFTLNDSVCNGSHGMKHFAELALQIQQRVIQGSAMDADDATPIECLRQFLDEEKKRAILKHVPEVVFTRHDGGSDNKNTLLQKMTATPPVTCFGQES
jgi:hypothetical protein